jgi:hypothetical protein
MHVLCFRVRRRRGVRETAMRAREGHLATGAATVCFLEQHSPPHAVTGQIQSCFVTGENAERDTAVAGNMES